MPLVTGPVGTLLVAGAAFAALVVWLLRRPRHPGPRLVGDDGIDREELEAAIAAGSPDFTEPLFGAFCAVCSDIAA